MNMPLFCKCWIHYFCIELASLVKTNPHVSFYIQEILSNFDDILNDFKLIFVEILKLDGNPRNTQILKTIRPITFFQDLVKSHLMSAVRSEVEELRDKISKLEVNFPSSFRLLMRNTFYF